MKEANAMSALILSFPLDVSVSSELSIRSKTCVCGNCGENNLGVDKNGEKQIRAVF